MELQDIDTIAVLGAGTMGHGIAEVAALAGYDVHLRDIEEDIVQDGYEQIEWSLDKLAENDVISNEDRDAAVESITPLVDLEEAVTDADIVIEAIIEEMEIKKDVYTDVEEYAPERAIFASNTSSLSITEISEVTDRPEQFCGMHFFNPPVRMDLVEVISGAHTSEETLSVVEDLAEDVGKTPVRVRKDEPGFIVNRILVPLMNEACWLVETEEATIAEVDSTTKYDIGLPMGAFELGDQVGNDVTLHVLDYMHEVLGAAYEPSPLLQRTVDDEHLGKKTGKGFYDYEDGGVEIPPDAGREDVESRLVAIMANEVGKLVEKDVAPVEDIDEAVKLGGGYPEGPAKMADAAGLDSLIETLEAAHEETGAARYEPSDGLRAAAEDGGFYGGDDEGEVSFETLRVETVEDRDYVGRIVVDRPHQMNTVSLDMLDELPQAVEQLEADDDVRAILIEGAGDRAFCAGADVQSFASSASHLEGRDLSRKGQQAFGALEETPLPVVAGIDGFTLGGGMELATCADIRVATDRSQFGQPEVNLGIIPGWGGTQRLANLIGESRAREIIFTGDRYDAAEMADYGFVSEVVDPEEFEEHVLDLTEEIAQGPPVAYDSLKRAMLAGRDDIDAGLEIEAQAFGHLLGTEDMMEGISAFFGDEEPEFEGK
ncbi:MAG: enoyl-CoA hydratase/3-hydroxyacyl-CoA dehydrogenase [Haloarculaceae archaeon]|jgi:enoyl-CoA hydratase/3-hydroxyacyl-CoA dehydrogenase